MKQLALRWSRWSIARYRGSNGCAFLTGGLASSLLVETALAVSEAALLLLSFVLFFLRAPFAFVLSASALVATLSAFTGVACAGAVVASIISPSIRSRHLKRCQRDSSVICAQYFSEVQEQGELLLLVVLPLLDISLPLPSPIPSPVSQHCSEESFRRCGWGGKAATGSSSSSSSGAVLGFTSKTESDKPADVLAASLKMSSPAC